MKRKISPKDNKSNQQNKNLGTSGTNPQNSQVHGHRGKQMNPNQQNKGGKIMGGNDMSQDELDLWSDINNPNNEADMDDWADAHNPNNNDYLGDDD